jgi:hypothetical protein
LLRQATQTTVPAEMFLGRNAVLRGPSRSRHRTDACGRARVAAAVVHRT